MPRYETTDIFSVTVPTSITLTVVPSTAPSTSSVAVPLFDFLLNLTIDLRDECER